MDDGREEIIACPNLLNCVLYWHIVGFFSTVYYHYHFTPILVLNACTAWITTSLCSCTQSCSKNDTNSTLSSEYHSIVVSTL